jgi:hypothetical protein
MNIDVFWSIAPDELGGMQFIPNPEFINLFNSTIMNLRDLPMFGTTGDVALLHIIFVIPMTVNDVKLCVTFRGVSGLNS